MNTLDLRYLRQLNGDMIQATKYVVLNVSEARDEYINLGVIREQFLK